MSAQPTTHGDFVWHPTPDDIENAHLTKFIHQHEITDLDELISRSTHDIAWFTEAILEYLKIEFYEPYQQVVDLSQGYAWPQWLVGGKMNIVHNCLDKYIGSPTEHHQALIWEGAWVNNQVLDAVLEEGSRQGLEELQVVRREDG